MNWLDQRWLAAGLALIAATTCAAVLVGAPAASVAEETTRSLPATLTVSGEFGAPGLRNSAVMSLPPSWPQAREVSTTALSWLGRVFGRAAGAERSPDIVACARRW